MTLHLLRSAARTRRGAIGLGLALVVVFVALIGPLVEPHSSTALVTTPFASPSGHALLGGDVLGRDVFSRLLDGGWKLLLMAAGATTIGIVLGAAAGVAAAHLQGGRDALIMRAVDVLLAFPQLVFALLLVSLLGSSTWLVTVAVGLSHAPQVARVLRASALDVSERDFVKAAQLSGLSARRVMVRELMPNLLSPLMVEVGLRLTYSIIVIAGLSFVGFGIQPPAANWGLMINENRLGLTQNYWAVVAPAIAVAMLTVGLNLFTDAVARVGLGVERAETLMVIDSAVGLDVAEARR